MASPTHSAAAIRLPAYESHCPVEIDGIHSRDLPVIGVGTLQALIMGIRLLGTLLHDFVSRGGRILDPDDDSEVPLEFLFGPMLRVFNAPDDSAAG